MQDATSTATPAIDAWLAGRPSSTRAEYRRDAEAFVASSGTQLEEATRADVQEWLDTLREEGGPAGDGLAPATLSRRRDALSSAFTFLVREGERDDNPAKRCHTPKIRRRRSEKYLSPQEVRRLCFIGARAGRDRLMLRTIYALALRASEVTRIEARDVRPADPANPGAAGLVDLWGKGEKETTMRMDGSPWPLLWRRAGTSDGGPLFDVSRQTVYNVVKRAAQRVQLPEKVSPHWLRHAAITHLLEARVPDHEVRDFARHASLETTSRYAHSRPGASPGAVLDA